MRWWARPIDGVLEATVVGSFSKPGFLIRRHLFDFQAPTRLDGRVAVVTGANSGLGLESATQMANLGATTYLWARNEQRARRARESIESLNPAADVRVIVADMADPDAIRAGFATISKEVKHLDVLVHNAGAIAEKYARSGFGTEETIASQLLGPFLLTTLCLPLLSQARPGRVITVASGGMYSEKFDLSTMEMTADGFDGVTAYARVKRAQYVINQEWSRRVAPSDVVFQAMHPGWADTPGVAKSLPRFHKIMEPLLRDSTQGADTIVWLATSPDAVSSSGQFWLDRRTRSGYKLPRTRPSDPTADAEKLWLWCVDHTSGEMSTPGGP